MVYYSNGYDLEKRQQSEARIDRIGQKYPMTYIDIYCEDTVDARIVKALKKKVNIASQIMGEELKAMVILKDGIQDAQPDEVIAFCRARLSHYKCPRSVDFVEDLGRNTMGKINKRTLRAPFWAGQKS